MNQEDQQKDIINRIKTIKGHLGGIEKMIEQDKKCEEILIQILAVKAAIDKIGTSIIENYAEKCILEVIEEPENAQNRIKDTIKTLIKFSK